MAKATRTKRGDLEQRLQALKSLSVQFVSFMIEEGLKGQALDKIVASFTRHQTKIVSGVMGSVGLAGGAWAAVSLWTSSIGVLSGLKLSLGLLSMPVWVPLAGGVAGLTAAGGAVYGALTLAKSRSKRRHVQSIVGFSKVLVGRDTFVDQDDRLMRRFLQAQDFKVEKAEELLKTTPEEARQLARKHLSEEDRAEIACYIFPLVYTRDGVISDTERRRFARICNELGLGEGESARISKDYRTRLDRQWEYLQILVRQLNFFADFMVFEDAATAKAWIREQGRPLVVKADGLAAGKGVVVAKDADEACEAVDRIMTERAFGEAGARVLIEEVLQGEEVSYHVLCDGEHWLPLAAAQDHKRAEIDAHHGDVGRIKAAPGRSYPSRGFPFGLGLNNQLQQQRKRSPVRKTRYLHQPPHQGCERKVHRLLY